MSKTIMLVPTGVGVGLTSVALGLVRAFEHHGAKVGTFRPVLQGGDVNEEFARHAIDYKTVENLLSSGRKDELLEAVVANYDKQKDENDIVIVQGVISTPAYPYAQTLNTEISKALDAKLILVATPSGRPPKELAEQVEIAAGDYGGIKQDRLLGAIINKVNGPVDERGHTRLDLAILLKEDREDQSAAIAQQPLFQKKGFPLLACIPWDIDLLAPRVIDIAKLLNADIVNPGQMEQRRIKHVSLCARSVNNVIDALKPATLIITPADRSDVILATALAALNGSQIAALLLTGSYGTDDNVMQFCQSAFATGLPVLHVPTDSFRTSINLYNLNMHVPKEDKDRIEAVKNFAARYFDQQWLQTLLAGNYEQRLSPPAFRYQLVEKARQGQKTIVLPEGDEPRTIQAAAICAQRNMARCVLLGDPSVIKRHAENLGVSFNDNITIINPKDILKNYIKPLVKLRKHKGLTTDQAVDSLQDNVVLGTMMLQQGEVDGLVSGAIHTTANTIRPALQLIKTAPGAQLVSSIFFMCLPDQVLVYGDCAVNPTPNAQELADIAIQSAHSAKIFGITPRIAMISYSTGSSGSGVDVDKVRQATELVKQSHPELIIDGPLQYDAALNAQVAKTKAPDSPVAGKATVFIFPDLNTGNTTYKAVQRSANVLSIGPMLQGLNKPVNDLSRGALVEDIVYTIALTAIQAMG